MGGVGDKLPLAVKGLSHSIEHVVGGVAQDSDLRRGAAHGHAHVPLARRAVEACPTLALLIERRSSRSN